MTRPLAKEDLDQINASLKGIKEIKEVIQRAEASGIDVAIQKEQLSTAEQRLGAIKAGFFPNGRA